MGIKKGHKRYRIFIVKRIVEIVKERSRPEDYILSFGLGVPTLSGRKSIKRYETYCDLHFSDRFFNQKEKSITLVDMSI